MNIESKKRYEFNRRFAKGEQYIQYSSSGNIVDSGKSYYWQEQEVYNHTLPIIEYLKAKYKNKITNKLLYGENGLVEQLIPVQRAYNALMNRSHEVTNRMCCPAIKVEDGSVDIDSLEEEGLAPGKVLVYRQGAKEPVAIDVKLGLLGDLANQQKMLQSEFNQIVQMFQYKIKELEGEK